MSRSVNQAITIGNLTRDPEMRYTPAGHAVTSFGVATNRSWVSDGEQREETEFHNVVAWNKLAELCAQLLSKGRRVYIQGRLQTRSWEGSDGVRRRKTEIVADEMILLDYRSKSKEPVRDADVTSVPSEETPPQVEVQSTVSDKEQEVKEEESKETSSEKEEVAQSEEITAEDIPF